MKWQYSREGHSDSTVYVCLLPQSSLLKLEWNGFVWRRVAGCGWWERHGGDRIVGEDNVEKIQCSENMIRVCSLFNQMAKKNFPIIGNKFPFPC